jgi:hypothetical protein
MSRRRKQNRRPAKNIGVSPTGGSRGCLCKDELTYSIECCDGSLWAQGIGRITAVSE